MHPRIVSLKIEDKVNIGTLNFDRVKHNIIYRNVVVRKIIKHYFEDHISEHHSYLINHLQEKLMTTDSLKDLMDAVVDLKKNENMMNLQFQGNGTKCDCFKGLY